MRMTVEPHFSRSGRPDGVVVYKHDVYPRGSVLAGRLRRTWVEMFETVEAAKAKYPKAEVLEHSTKMPAEYYDLGPNPPRWFDPAAAGERWDDDY